MEIKLNQLTKMRKNFESKSCQKLVQRGVMKNGILDSSQNEDVIGKNNFVFSDDVDSEAVANQNQSGRCWMYACLNTLRFHIEKELKLPHGSFQLSQNYTFFYDKMEKANFFHQQIIDTANEPLSDRRMVWLLQTPQQDGGDWDLITAIIEKYGVVPKNQMDETHASINSAELNTVLNRKLRQDAITLRELVHKRASESEIQKERDQMMEDVYRILSIALGTPPDTIDFEYRDTDKKYHADRGLTPKEFYDKYIGINLNDYVGIINVPIDRMPYNKLYGIEMSNEIINGRPNRYINIDMETLKSLVIKQLQAGEPVWFGSDVMQSSNIFKGVMATDLYDLGETFGVDFTMNKAQRYEYLDSMPTHAMVIAGVDLVDGKPVKWKVENSWGAKAKGKAVGNNGYFVMDDDWMDNFTYEVVINKKFMSKELQDILSTEPIMLPYWSSFNPVAILNDAGLE